MAITHVKHIDIFLAIYRHYKRIGQCYVKGKRADLFATALRVLELMREEQIKLLLASGVAEEDITEEMLGFPMLWEHFQERALGHYGKRSFEGIIEKVLLSGAARRCYVECHRRKREDGREELALVRDDGGRPITYLTIEEAREKRRSGGDIINFFYFNATAVNDLTKALYGLATPQPPTPDDDGPGGGPGSNNKKEGAQRDSRYSEHAEQPPSAGNPENKNVREGYLRTDSSSVSPDGTIPQGSQFSEGMSTDISQNARKSARVAQPEGAGSQICARNVRKTAREGSQNGTGKARKTASNKNLIGESLELCLENNLISAPGAIRLTLSHFDFSQPITTDAITQLSRILLPALPSHYKTEEDKEAAYARVEAAAQALANFPLIHQFGLRHFACLLAYQGDDASPCSWRAYCRRKNAGFVPRLWHLENEMVLWKMNQEMGRFGWWPDYLPQPVGLVETPPEIDLAELAGIDRDDRIGMDAETCQAVEGWLAGLLTPHGYEVGHRRVGATRERGYAIAVRYTYEDGTRRILRIYSLDEWYLVVEAEALAPIGSLDFIRHLDEAVRRNRVA